VIAPFPCPGVYSPDQIKLRPVDLKDLKRQIQFRERLLCRPGLEREERLTIGQEYIELRALEDACG
jgi:hypothetical protein